MNKLIVIGLLSMAACSPAVAQKDTVCWNKHGQHNHYPGCPWYATGGGDIVSSPTGNSGSNNIPSNDFTGSDEPNKPTSQGPDKNPGGSPDDSGSGGDTPKPSDPSKPTEPNEPSGGNPGNDKPVGSSNDKRPDHAKPDDGEKGNSDNKPSKPSKKCGCKKVAR